MKTTAYLVVSKSGRIRVSKKKPILASNEVAVLTILSIPNSVFDFVPVVHKVIVTDDCVMKPFEVSDTVSQIDVGVEKVV